ncbi:hypothetical protein [Citrobacter enshiensis]|uniref:hypothetical protein n=1 Tax=Citrobacter enshiensis TaxID=2971264 RepID=UPI0023E76D1B|nr:hypothetical protein [Citrobacter enshiensis]WET42480.1 hypothetical protein P2W74_10795 [Citrobacter enshiensis]
MKPNKQGLTAESARESGNILLIVAARMVRRELFTPLHFLSELPKRVVSMRDLRDALERCEEALQREVCKIVDGHDRMAKKLKEAEAKLEVAEKRIAEMEAREVKVKQFSEFQICHYGASEDYAKGYIDCQKNYNKALGAANILVSMEE